ncbi:MAG: class I SAM-dependent methyltransferase [Acidobacteria bacterium]|nr:class I SAM-dependent methyltransferase [Acidobacteriota bacterium]
MKSRSEGFAGRAGPRYWWFRTVGRHYVPPVFAALTDDEWSVLEAWFAATDAMRPDTGECNVPAISVLHGLVMGSGIGHVVQLGHYLGYSTLLLGFMMRRMSRRRGVFSIDIDAEATDFTRAWIARAHLEDYVQLMVCDSADPEAPRQAHRYFGAEPDLVFVDSSHQYRQTLSELDLWYGQLRPGGLLLLHDASAFATQFDPRGEGGVQRALSEWLKRAPVPAILLNEGARPGVAGDTLVYGDPCGLGIVQRPL